MNKKNILLVLGLASTLLVAGCGNNTGDTNNPTPNNNNPSSTEADKIKNLETELGRLKKAIEQKTTEGQEGTSGGTTADATVLKGDAWAHSYKDMCDIVAKQFTNLSEDQKKVLKAITDNKLKIENAAGYDAKTGAAKPVDTSFMDTADPTALLKIYTAQTALDPSPAEKINEKVNGTTYADVEGAFYTALLNKVIGSKDPILGFLCITQAYDLSWYFVNTIFPQFTADKKGNLADMAAVDPADNLKAFFADADKVTQFATVIKLLAVKFQKTIYDCISINGSWDLFNDSGVLNNWDLKNLTERRLIYAEAKAIAALGTQTDNALKVALLDIASATEYLNETKNFTGSLTSKSYDSKSSKLEPGMKFLLERYYNLLDLMAIDGEATKPDTFTHTVDCVTFDDAVMVFHAWNTPRMLAARVAAGVGTTWAKPAAWDANSPLQFPTGAFSTDAAVSKTVTGYYVRRSSDLGVISAGAGNVAYLGAIYKKVDVNNGGITK